MAGVLMILLVPPWWTSAFLGFGRSPKCLRVLALVLPCLGCALVLVLAGVQSTLPGPSTASALGAWFVSAAVMRHASCESRYA